jgi:hypothetical protein
MEVSILCTIILPGRVEFKAAPVSPTLSGRRLPE